jgi:Domain of unknown function (DUF4148)
MKFQMIAIAIAGAMTTVSAFAQTAQPTPQVAAIAQSTVNAGGQWVPPNGQPIVQKTRAQVYQELVQAEQDGQLAYLNSTVYAHP